jgi:hypothetical protein
MAMPPFFRGGLAADSSAPPCPCGVAIELLVTLREGVVATSGGIGGATGRRLSGGGGKKSSADSHPAAEGGGSVKREGAGGTGSFLNAGGDLSCVSDSGACLGIGSERGCSTGRLS